MFWAQLKTPDLDAVMAFYSALLGWRVDVNTGGPGLPKGACVLGGTTEPVAGMASMSAWEVQQDEPPRWTPFVPTPDAVAMTERAQFHGATLIEPAMPAGGDGWRAVLSDPTGAEFGIWETTPSAAAPPIEVSENPAPGSLVWSELQTTDPYAARDFYGDLLVWSCVDDHPSDEFLGDDIRFSRGNAPIARLRSVTRAEVSDAPRWLPGFAVENLDEAAKRAGDLGGAAHEPPSELECERPEVVVLDDPTGASCLLVAS
ncbi:hypothetical protein CRI94_14430 [Longibacter salinarum]|uniref:VOC domain-containing protein n=1 Tax=Longibacter salinarum TaxID=1850348 RepID=A0A2A8CUQ2_9BACT|nr:VOC family protein [Longibacter salinarum]PEN12233.1 hypothetical protein CRI94_14430 [Longibacter salinarum]